MPLIPIFVQNELNASEGSRVSAFNFCNPFDHVLPPVDGSIGALDRQHLWGLYIGIPTSDVTVGIVKYVTRWYYRIYTG